MALSASDNWHGFGEIGEDFAMLDPIKVTLTTPGLSIDGEFGDFGIPGLVLSKYLAEHGVVVEKTGLYSLFILFTIGVTKGRWNTLIAELHRFKSAVDSNVRIDEIMPEFVAESPQYAGLGLKDLCQRLHELYREHDFANLTTDIYLEEPAVALLPTDAWAAMTSGKIEHVGISRLEGRISAVLLTPYPPGIRVARARGTSEPEDRRVSQGGGRAGSPLPRLQRHHPWADGRVRRREHGGLRHRGGLRPTAV